MSLVVVKQPNQLLAIFDTNVALFTKLNVTTSEAMRVMTIEWGITGAKRMVQTSLNNGQAGWKFYLKVVKTTHGKKVVRKTVESMIDCEFHIPKRLKKS